MNERTESGRRQSDGAESTVAGQSRGVGLPALGCISLSSATSTFNVGIIARP